jgi:hypothetical protein
MDNGLCYFMSFAILINGSTLGFFKPTTELRQGFPLSPLPFLLVVEGLSRAILEAKRVSIISKICNGGVVSLSHLRFVDDVLLLSKWK